MASNSRVLNVTRNCYLKRGAVERGLAECSIGWVEVGVSVRNLTPAESRIARIEQAKQSEPFPCAELPGLRFQVPARLAAAMVEEISLAWQAHSFVRSATMRAA